MAALPTNQATPKPVSKVEALPEADLLEPGRFAWTGGKRFGPWVLNGSFEHLHEHAAMIDDWLARLYGEG